MNSKVARERQQLYLNILGNLEHPQLGVCVFAIYSPTPVPVMSMHYIQQNSPRPTTFVVRCKLCGRNVHAGVEKFPRTNTVVRCPLCGELRRYRPTEVFLGWVDGLVEEQKASRRFRPFVRKAPRRDPDREE